MCKLKRKEDDVIRRLQIIICMKIIYYIKEGIDDNQY